MPNGIQGKLDCKVLHPYIGIIGCVCVSKQKSQMMSTEPPFEYTTRHMLRNNIADNGRILKCIADKLPISINHMSAVTSTCKWSKIFILIPRIFIC